MDLTPFTDVVTDITTAIPTTGAAVVGVAAAAMTITFVIAWIRKAYKASKG